jgi:hypothetical protein
LANEKTPLRDAVPSTPERAKKTAARSTVARRRAIVAIVGIVLAVVALFLIFGGNGANPITTLINPPPPAPTFAFDTVHTAFVPTAIKVQKKDQKAAADGIAPHVEKVITQLFQKGYVNPDTWGDAGEIEGLFTDDAAKQVETNIDTLTLGTDAGDTYSGLTPMPSTIKITALTDADAQAIRAMAQVTFRGKATGTDGTYTDIEVTGTLFLVPDGNDWKIEAFNLRRSEEPGNAPRASASAASPSESA